MKIKFTHKRQSPRSLDHVLPNNSVHRAHHSLHGSRDANAFCSWRKTSCPKYLVSARESPKETTTFLSLEYFGEYGAFCVGHEHGYSFLIRALDHQRGRVMLHEDEDIQERLSPSSSGHVGFYLGRKYAPEIEQSQHQWQGSTTREPCRFGLYWWCSRPVGVGTKRRARPTTWSNPNHTSTRIQRQVSNGEGNVRQSGKHQDRVRSTCIGGVIDPQGVNTYGRGALHSFGCLISKIALPTFSLHPIRN